MAVVIRKRKLLELLLIPAYWEMNEMKKSTVGMLILGSMIFTKAFLMEGSSSNSIVSRDNSLQSNFQEALVIRAQNGGMIAPVANLFASNFDSPSFDFVPPVQVSEEIRPSNELTNFTENVALVNPVDEVKEEIIPMDYVSNTGYGLWKTSEEKIISKEERDGKIPLDIGNTISDNISKLFPRVP